MRSFSVTSLLNDAELDALCFLRRKLHGADLSEPKVVACISALHATCVSNLGSTHRPKGVDVDMSAVKELCAVIGGVVDDDERAFGYTDAVSFIKQMPTKSKS